MIKVWNDSSVLFEQNFTEPSPVNSGTYVLENSSGYLNQPYFYTAQNSSGDYLEGYTIGYWGRGDTWLGDFNTTGSYISQGSTGLTNTTGFWLCTASDCSSTCQVSITGGLITACT